MEYINCVNEDMECELFHDVEYVNRDGIRRVMQIIKPNYFNKDVKHPLVVYVQGSAWHKQDVYRRLPSMAYIARQGFVVASIEYRESELAPFPAQVQDAKTAIRFLRKNADKYNIDTNNVYVWGDSSGGHTALLTGLTKDVKELDSDVYSDYSIEVNGIIDFYGVVDIRDPQGFPSNTNQQKPDSHEGIFIGGLDVLENLDISNKTVVTNYLDHDIPPILMMHGDSDSVVSFRQSETLYNELVKRDKDVTFYVLKGADHGGPTFFNDSTLNIVVNFMKQHLKEKTNG